MTAFRKSLAGMPARYAGWEAAGLRWLAAAEPDGGAAVVDVIGVTPEQLTLTRVPTTTPTAAAGREFGAALARTHAAGAPGWGAPPDGWVGDGWLGPSGDVLPLSCRAVAGWGTFWAEQRILPLLGLAADRGLYDATQTRAFEQLAGQVADGRFDTGDTVSRLHGDLWSGNLLWSPDGVVLIDPAAHGGHREADLAMLALFGTAHLPQILAGYQEVSPLSDGWADRVPLHQLHPLLAHVLLFGGGYRDAALDVARRYVGG